MKALNTLVALTLLSSLAFAAGAKETKALDKKAAESILAKSDTKANKDYLASLSKTISTNAKLGGLSGNVDKALSYKSADYLVVITKIAETNVEASKALVELSAGVRSEADATQLAQHIEKIASGKVPKELSQDMNKEIESGKSYSEALEIAAEKYAKAKNMSVKDWIEAFLKCA